MVIMDGSIMDNDFDLSEEDFLQAALDIENAAIPLKKKDPVKRRSFELGGPSKTRDSTTSELSQQATKLHSVVRNERDPLGLQKLLKRTSDVIRGAIQPCKAPIAKQTDSVNITGNLRCGSKINNEVISGKLDSGQLSANVLTQNVDTVTSYSNVIPCDNSLASEQRKCQLRNPTAARISGCVEAVPGTSASDCLEDHIASTLKADTLSCVNNSTISGLEEPRGSSVGENISDKQKSQPQILFQINQDSSESDLDLSIENLSSWMPSFDASNVNNSARFLHNGEINRNTTTFKSPISSNACAISKSEQKSPISNHSVRGNQTTNSVVELTSHQNLSFTNDSYDISPNLKGTLAKQRRPFDLSRTSAFQDMDSTSQCSGTKPLSSIRTNLIPDDLQVATPVSSCIETISRRHDEADTRTLAETPIPRNNVHALRTPAVCSSSSTWSTPKSTKASSSSLDSTQTSMSGRRKRKFPGPAGVLPKLKPGLSLEDVNVLKPVSPVITPKRQCRVSADLPNSQSWSDRISGTPWRDMLEELEPQALHVLKEFDIDAIHRRASKRQLPKSKVPIVVAMLDQIEGENPEASVVLRDASGEIRGTLHRQLRKDYPAHLQPGSVLVLKQVSLFSPTERNHYLNVTPNNVVRIYGNLIEGASRTIIMAAFSEEDFVIPDFHADQSFLNTNGQTGTCHKPNISFGRGMMTSPKVQVSRPGQSLWQQPGGSGRQAVPGLRPQTPARCGPVGTPSGSTRRGLQSVSPRTTPNSRVEQFKTPQSNPPRMTSRIAPSHIHPLKDSNHLSHCHRTNLFGNKVTDSGSTSQTQSPGVALGRGQVNHTLVCAKERSTQDLPAVGLSVMNVAASSSQSPGGQDTTIDDLWQDDLLDDLLCSLDTPMT